MLRLSTFWLKYTSKSSGGEADYQVSLIVFTEENEEIVQWEP